MSVGAPGGGGAARYTAGAIVLHWLIALLVLAQIAGGWAMTALVAEGSGAQFNLFQLHKSLGVGVLLLTLARILWRAFNPPPPVPAELAPWERGLAAFVHAAFYALLLAIPLSGWLLVTVSPVRLATVLFFVDALGWPHLPGFDGLAEPARTRLAEAAGTAHAVLAYALAALAALHVAGALKHQFAQRGYLRRMVPHGATSQPTRRPLLAGAVTLALPALFLLAMVAIAAVARHAAPSATPGTVPDAPRAAGATGVAGAPVWIVDPQTSALRFTLRHAGRTVEGTFGRWTAQIRFAPDDLPSSSLVIEVDTSSATLPGGTITTAQLSGPDGFDDAAYGRATFRSDAITREGEAYVARGSLTMRGTSRPQAVAFSVTIAGETATATANATIARLDYAIGAGSDPSATVLGALVTVDAKVTARRAEAGAAAAN